MENLIAEVTIEATRNGPYLITGPIELRDTDGRVLSAKNKIWLCRCGASTKKPFCDGTHSKIGFQAAARGGARVSRRGLIGARSLTDPQGRSQSFWLAEE
jgi:3-phenylpropionate/trans-cinnamate dioxygenase ferredoxin subunit